MSINIKRAIVLNILIITTITAIQAQSAGWRGPGRSGVYNETGLLKVWPASGPALIWEASGMGTGFSSVTVTDEAVYITGRKGESDILTAYTQDGKKKWDVEYGLSSKSNFPDTRCTPSVVNGKILLVSGQGDMVCINKDGKIIWTVNYFQKYDARFPMFGISESPVVARNLVIGTPGGKKASMVSFNIENGKVAWEAPSVGEETSYVNPLLIDDNGLKLIVTITKGLIIAVNPDNGKLVWKFNYEGANDKQTGERNHANTPVYRDGFLFAGNGYGQVGVKLKLNPDGSEPTVVWKNSDFNPHIGGMVLIGNYLYGSTHDSNSKGRWICVDWTTGKTMWTTLWNNKGPIISADGMIFIMEEKSGNVALVKPGSQKLDVVSSFRVTKGEGPYWAHPVIDKGRLFIRHGSYLAVYSIK
ncbi:MAG: PQQ-binding-like beta-propeller repeat protein [Bacteroidales bacterium]